MKINAYLLFPETDEDFLRIGNNPQTYQDLIKEVASIKQQLKKHQDFELCYDSTNVDLFLGKAEILIGGEYLAKCRTQLERIFWNNTKNVITAILREEDCIYVNWNVNCIVEVTKNLIAEAAETKHQEEEDKTVLVNISDAYVNNRESIHIIKDAIQYNELPLLITIPIANNEIEFSEWYSTLSSEGFSLRDKTKFERTAFRWNKQTMFREIATGRYWYYDYFHKDNIQHYEVFAGDGANLGIANTLGVLDTSKAKDERRIDNIIK